MALNDTEELSVHCTTGGQDVVNTYHFRLLSADLPGPPTIEQVLIDEWQATCQNTYRLAMSGYITIARVSARQVCGALPLRARVDETVNLVGQRTTSGDAAPTWLAVLVRERSAFAGRSYQGRNFYHVGAESDFSGNSLTSGVITALEAYNTALLGAFGPAGTSTNFRLVIHSVKRASVPGTQCQDSSTPVLSLSVSPYVTSMRSRRSRSGA